MPLAAAQQLLGKPGLIKHVFVANRGGGWQRHDRVIAALNPTLAGLGLEADNSKQDALELADEQGAAFMSHVHDIRIVLDRRRHPADLPDLRDAGSRAPGRARHRACRRYPPQHLVQMFLYEGLAYDLRGRGRRRAARHRAWRS